jgi:hypothetical protein
MRTLSPLVTLLCIGSCLILACSNNPQSDIEIIDNPEQCRDLVDEFTEAMNAALLTPESVACNLPEDCTHLALCQGSSCTFGAIVNQGAADAVNQISDPNTRCPSDCLSDVDVDESEDLSPCAFPGSNNVDCLEGVCYARFEDKPDEADDIRPETCEEKQASMTTFLDFGRWETRRCQEDSDCRAFSFSNGCTNDTCVALPAHQDDLGVFEARLAAHLLWNACDDCGPAADDCYAGPEPVCDRSFCRLPMEL